MKHSLYFSVGLALLACSSSLLASPISAKDLLTNPAYRTYHVLSTENPSLAGLSQPTTGAVAKASGIVPKIDNGLVAWADGRNGNAVICGYRLDNIITGEFLVSNGDTSWQEGNPYVGSGIIVHDSIHSSSAGGDPGNIDSATSTNWSVASPAHQNIYSDPTDKYIQNSSAIGGINSQIQGPDYAYVAWVDYRNTGTPVPAGVSGTNTDIFYQRVDVTSGSPIDPTPQSILSIVPQNGLAMDGNLLAYTESRQSGVFADYKTQIAVHDLASNSEVAWLGDRAKNCHDADIAGNMVVWTQNEATGDDPLMNIYMQSLVSGSSLIQITTHGRADKAAISSFMDGDEERFLVVWQQYEAGDAGDTDYNMIGGYTEKDHEWDIWCQEVSGDGSLIGSAFLVNTAVDNLLHGPQSGRQTNPDIDGLDIVWQTQGLDVNSEDVENIYVVGPMIVPEPTTMLLLLAGLPAVLGLRRNRKH